MQAATMWLWRGVMADVAWLATSWRYMPLFYSGVQPQTNDVTLKRYVVKSEIQINDRK